METYAIIIRKTQRGKFSARWIGACDTEQYRTILRESASEALAEVEGVMKRREVAA